MTLHYPYTTRSHPDGTTSKVPIIPITLIGQEIIITGGVVDSGADSCAISLPMAKRLGLPLDGPKEITRGVGGIVESAESQFILSLRQGNEKYRFNIPVKVILKNLDFPVLLGQDGFFDKFIITFNRSEESFTLKRPGSWF